MSTFHKLEKPHFEFIFAHLKFLKFFQKRGSFFNKKGGVSEVGGSCFQKRGYQLLSSLLAHSVCACFASFLSTCFVFLTKERLSLTDSNQQIRDLWK